MDKNKNQFSPSTKIDILLYIALSEEFNDLTDILINELDTSFRPCELDDLCVTIWYGSIYSPVQDRKIRLAVVPAGKMGITRAASVTSAVLTTSTVRDVVVLGIAGALSEDLQPGDVFIPDSVNEYLANSATRGKTKQWIFETSGTHYPTSPRLLDRFQLFRSVHPELFKQWSDGCDARFSTVATHPVRHALTKLGLKLRHKPGLVAGDDRKLASGPVVGKGNAFVQWVKTNADRKVAALEMESAGVYDAVHIRDSAPRIIAIRGISDFADERKELIEDITNDGFRSVSIINALSLLIFGIRAGLFGHNRSKERAAESGIPADAGTREPIIEGPEPTATEQTDTPDDRHTQNVICAGNPKQIIRECLTRSFSNREEIDNFCFEYSDELHREIRNEDGFATIVRKIIQHCYANDCHDQLWQSIKTERPSQFIKYHAMWEQTID
ncbi:MAG: hypothetical protein GY737_27845 [Desulfobacteraceae bacterium]|nr:hypothetical protein [Desulfobacteraceae bacterium]